MKLNKILVYLIILAMIFPCVVNAADSARGKTIRLESYKGTLIITSGSGKVSAVTEKMRIFDGYIAKTGAESEAYFSLDDKKAIKMDQNTEVTIKKKWFSNEIKVVSGTIFFNVTAPLENNETLNITSPTISMGIRGTSGLMKVDEEGTNGQLYTGKVEISGSKGGKKHMNAGQKVNDNEKGEGNDQIEISDLEKDGSDIPATALKEINKDLELRAKVKEQTDLNVENFENQEEINKEKEEETRLKKLEIETKEREETIKQKSENKKSVTPNGDVTGKSSGGGSPTLTFGQLLSWVCSSENNAYGGYCNMIRYMSNYNVGVNIESFNNINVEGGVEQLEEIIGAGLEVEYNEYNVSVAEEILATYTEGEVVYMEGMPFELAIFKFQSDNEGIDPMQGIVELINECIDNYGGFPQ